MVRGILLINFLSPFIICFPSFVFLSFDDFHISSCCPFALTNDPPPVVRLRTLPLDGVAKIPLLRSTTKKDKKKKERERIKKREREENGSLCSLARFQRSMTRSLLYMYLLFTSVSSRRLPPDFFRNSFRIHVLSIFDSKTKQKKRGKIYFLILTSVARLSNSSSTIVIKKKI